MLLRSSGNPAEIVFRDDTSPIKELVKRGNQYGVPILMSLGGWTGSETFSIVAADSGLRRSFINNAMVFVRKNGWDMDGIDIDW